MAFPLTQIADVIVMIEGTRASTVTINKILIDLFCYVCFCLKVYIYSLYVCTYCHIHIHISTKILSLSYLLLIPVALTWICFQNDICSQIFKFLCLPRTTCLFNFKFILTLLYTQISICCAILSLSTVYCVQGVIYSSHFHNFSYTLLASMFKIQDFM